MPRSAPKRTPPPKPKAKVEKAKKVFPNLEKVELTDIERGILRVVSHVSNASIKVQPNHHAMVKFTQGDVTEVQEICTRLARRGLLESFGKTGARSYGITNKGAKALRG